MADKRSKTKKIATLSLMAVLSMMLSYLDAIIIAPVGILGFKLGLANLLILWVLYAFGWKEALLVNLVRILLSAMLFTNPMALAFSLIGGAFAFTAMCAGKRSGLLPVTGIGILGGVFHNAGQSLAAAFFFSAYAVRSYLPILLVLGLITGACNGILAGILHKRVSRYLTGKQTKI
ncbi:MAG: Gx transporter family protein [Lachnospiraceae bacterium]|nr:Gx transporter family protein [Lachnospiraceae bacterium]